MKRRCKEGTVDLKGYRNYFRLLVCLFSVIPAFASRAQVPINGFCGISEFKLDKPYSSLQPVSFNEDGYTDLLLFNSKTGDYEILQGMDNLNFVRRSESRTAVKISAISYLNTHSTNELVFLSRQSRRQGILKINAAGVPSFRSMEKLPSFPESVTTIELENDHTPEYIINGSSYQGISIMRMSAGKISLQSFFKNSSFQYLQAADFNGDGYADICAYDLKTSNIDMFYNNTRGNMRFVRAFQPGGSITNLKAFDFNLDNYQDFSYSIGKELVFRLGDSVHSFQLIQKVILNKQPRKIIYGDFNKDGKIDFAYIDEDMNSISVAFQRDSMRFYPEIEYFCESKLLEIIPFYSKYTDGFAVLSGGNKIIFFEQVAAFGNSVKLAPCSASSVPFSFDYQNDGLTDIGILDRNQQSVNLFLRNKNGIPAFFYRLPLTITAGQVFVDDSRPENKVFYVVDSSRAAMEIIEYNFQNSQFARKSIVLSGKLLSARMSYYSGQARLLCVINKGSELTYSRMSSEKILYSHKIARLMADDILLDGQILKTGDYFFASRNRDSVIWNVYDFKNHSVQTLYKTIDKKRREYRTFVYDFYNTGSEQMLIVTRDNANYMTYMSYMNGRSIPSPLKNELGKNINLAGNQYFGQYDPSALNRFFIQTAPDKITRFDFLRSKRRILITEFLRPVDINDFIIRNLSGEVYSLIYTASSRNYLAIERI